MFFFKYFSKDASDVSRQSGKRGRENLFATDSTVPGGRTGSQIYYAPGEWAKKRPINARRVQSDLESLKFHPHVLLYCQRKIRKMIKIREENPFRSFFLQI